MKDIIILGIETSCDETAASVVRGGREVLSDVISSQADIHSIYGGVVPEIASRKHTEMIVQLTREALLKANVKKEDITAVAVTYGPGLVGALLVGVSFAKAFAYSLGKPLVPVHHIKGHIAANYVQHESLAPPFVCLVASGGHSHIVYAEDTLCFEILGRTKDDAAGEAFDKVARVLGLGYPGGPAVQVAAEHGNKNAVKFPRVTFENSLDFSFSGVKTAVINYLHKMEQNDRIVQKEDIAASFQEAVTDILVRNTIKACKNKNCTTLLMAGGVAANSELRRKMQEAAEEEGITLLYPSPRLCTDNAVMIACAGYYEFMAGKTASLHLNAHPYLEL